MKAQIRRTLAREPYEKKIRKVEQLVRLAREFPRRGNPSPDKKVAEILKNDLGVKESYEHAPKRATPGESIETNGAVVRRSDK
jgi:hypothetical protein